MRAIVLFLLSSLPALAEVTGVFRVQIRANRQADAFFCEGDTFDLAKARYLGKTPLSRVVLCDNRTAKGTVRAYAPGNRHAEALLVSDTAETGVEFEFTAADSIALEDTVFSWDSTDVVFCVNRLRGKLEDTSLAKLERGLDSALKSLYGPGIALATPDRPAGRKFPAVPVPAGEHLLPHAAYRYQDRRLAGNDTLGALLKGLKRKHVLLVGFDIHYMSDAALVGEFLGEIALGAMAGAVQGYTAAVYQNAGMSASQARFLAAKDFPLPGSSSAPKNFVVLALLLVDRDSGNVRHADQVFIPERYLAGSRLLGYGESAFRRLPLGTPRAEPVVEAAPQE